MRDGNYNATADIFSFGIVISEAIAAQEAEEIVDATRTPQFGLDVPKLHSHYCDGLSNGALKQIVKGMIELAGRCCALEPTERPTTDQIIGRLQRIQLEYQAKHLRVTGRPKSPTKIKAQSPRHQGSSALSNIKETLPFLSKNADDESDDSTLKPIGNVDENDDDDGHEADEPMVDPRAEEAASLVFELVDQDADGYLDYSETQLLAKLSDDYDLDEGAYKEICEMVGAESEKGLTQDQVVQMYTHLKIGDAEADLQKLHESCQW